MAAPVATFDGFGPDALGFLSGLEADNSKEYFDAHRSVYDVQVASPLKALVVAVGEALQERIDRPLEFAPKVGASLFRINRDRRFHPDLPPYQTHLDLCWWTGASPKTDPAFIARITSNEVLTGVGVFRLEPERLERWRAAVAGSPGADLAAMLDRLTSPPVGASISEPTRTRVPKGWPAHHERADLLRRDGLHVSVTRPVPSSLTTEAFAPWLVEHLVVHDEVHRWLHEHTR